MDTLLGRRETAVSSKQLPGSKSQVDEPDVLADKIQRRLARIGVVGLGHAGLPLATVFARAGFAVVGVDTNHERVAAIHAGESPVTSVDHADVRAVVEAGNLCVTDNVATLANVDCVLICVPTPLTSDDNADLRWIKEATLSVGRHLQEGALVVLESTCPAGTTRQVVAPILEDASGLRVGIDFHLAFAPERIDPGNRTFGIHNTPQLIGGMTIECRRIASLLFGQIVERIVPVASPEIAEMAKVFENTFRFVNIGLVNQMAVLCDQLRINVWDVIDAAATKPFGFMPHYPGPGVGGDCIPVVPFFLATTAKQAGVPIDIVEASARANAKMPAFVVSKLSRLLHERGQNLDTASVLLLGVAYKRDSTDVRHSPAVRVLDALLEAGIAVDYYDPHVPVVSSNGRTLSSLSIEEVTRRRFDCALLLTPHSAFDYDVIARHVGFILDTRNGLSHESPARVVSL